MRLFLRWSWVAGALATLTAAGFIAFTMGNVQDASRASADLGELRAFAERIGSAATTGDEARLAQLHEARVARAQALEPDITRVAGAATTRAAFDRIEAGFEALEAATAQQPQPPLLPLTEPIAAEVDALLDVVADRRAASVDTVRRLAAAGVVLTLTGTLIGVGASLLAARRIRVLADQEAAATRRYASLVASMQNGILVMDEQGTVLYCNQALADMLGYQSEQIIGSSGARLFPPDRLGELHEYHVRAMVQGEVLAPTLTRRLHADGTLVDVVVAVTPIFEGARCVATLSEYRNVTQEVALRQQVGYEVAKGESIMDAAPVPIVVIGEDGIVVAANPAVTDTFGWAAEDLTGRSVTVLMPEPFASHHDGFMKHYLLTGEPSTDAGLFIGHERPAFALHRDGHQFPISLRIAESRSVDGHRIFTGVIHDLTLRTDQETERLRLLESILNDQRDVAVGTLVAGVAHDFNNLLTAIIGALDLEISARGQSSRWLDHASGAARRATSVVRRLLHAARPLASELQPTDVWEVIRGTVELARETFDRRVSISVFRSGDLPLILADPSRLEQVLLNLLLNARDATLERAIDAGPGYAPEIRVAAGIATRPEGRQFVRIVVSDNGVGMSTETQQHLFDPFFTTKGSGRGTGLGMTMVREIVREIDAAIETDSALGVGTTITIDCPTIPEGQPAAVAGATAHRHGPPVLIVDDEEGVRDVVSAALEQQGYTAIVAPEGEAALEILRLRDDVRLVLLNLNMPGLNGWDVLSRIRTHQHGPPVVIVSGSVQAADALRRGAVGVIQKPFPIDTLISSVATHLGGNPAAEDPHADREPAV